MSRVPQLSQGLFAAPSYRKRFPLPPSYRKYFFAAARLQPCGPLIDKRHAK
jgi:hypothetical protein